ncbi:hypothetical protein HYQ45_013265 [Verticillium longisporum]|uniref:Uncharacterized protein n=1 Tax=Verticillium longisporum TaxID=100787 RepID=A0A8I2ZCV3_VERLO|nr:hypothetical protein HYQ45_013265 [Verticillium longisporum]
MVSDSSSNIRVFIRWDDQTVFAGEEIKCTITFKNVAADPSQHKQTQRQANGTEAREGACAGSQLAHYAPGWPRDLWTSVSITTAGQLSDVQIYTYVRSTPPVSRSINLAKYSRHRRPFPTVTVTF